MILKNVTQNKLITTHAKEASSLKDKSLGLVLKSNPRHMVFKTRLGIHTFGMSSSIDIIILDKKNLVVALKESLKPFRVFFWNPKYSKVLEVPAGTIRESNTILGDLIRLD